MRAKLSQRGIQDYEGVMMEDLQLKHYISAHLNINTETGIPHTELDLVYTLLGVPRQSKVTQICFFIQIDGNRDVWFRMRSGFHILYSAHLLTHRQKVNSFILNGNVNISAYTPKRFFSQFR